MSNDTKTAALAFFVYCTLASPTRYTNHADSGNDLPLPITTVGPDGVEVEGVEIKGGAGLADTNLITPRGVVTKVTEAQLEYLRRNPVFQLHEKNKFVVVSEHLVDADQVAADMTGRDNSAPIVPADLEKMAEANKSERATADVTATTGKKK